MEKEWLEIWNQKHIEYTVKGPKYRNQKMVEFIVETLKAAKKAYYESSIPIMSDASYDSFEMRLKILDHDNEFLTIVGS